MKRKRGLDSNERAELWQRWRAGESLSDIARALNKAPGSVFCFIASEGGISPAPRKRAPRALTVSEREEISRGLGQALSLRKIAASLGRPVSTISREVKRNGGVTAYRATDAEVAAWKRARRPQRCKLAVQHRLRRCVASKLCKNWSPQQISGWLKKRYPSQTYMRVSHETIYRSLYIQTRGVLKKELQAHLRTQRTMRRSQQSTTAGQQRGQIIDAVSISQRPASVDDRAVPGHWEGDLIRGSKNSHIATLVERQSRFVLLVRVQGKDSTTVVTALRKHLLTLPQTLRQSLTWDRGTELARHKELRIATDIQIYFCDPRSPWQRGTNENTNGLLRQYFPKGTELSGYSQAQLNKVARQLNERPRKTLGFQTPADILGGLVAMTH